MSETITPTTDVQPKRHKQKQELDAKVNIGITSVNQLQLSNPQLNLIGRALTENMKEGERDVAYELAMNIMEQKAKHMASNRSQAESILEHLKENKPQ